jgi:hypothetical protein
MAIIPFCCDIKWYSTRWSLRTTLLYPLDSNIHHCHTSTRSNARQTYFPETNHSDPFELTHVLTSRLHGDEAYLHQL